MFARINDRQLPETLLSHTDRPALAEDSLRARLAKGITWNIAGSLFTQANLFFCNVLLANILGRTVFGEFGMVQNTFLTLAGIAQVGTGYTATKFLAEFRYTEKEKAGRVLGLCSLVTGITGCVATVMMLVSAQWLATSTLKAPHLHAALLFASASVLFTVLNGYQLGALAGLESFKSIARSGAIHGVLHLAVCSGAAWMWGFHGAVGGFVVSSLLRWFIFHRAVADACAGNAISFIYRGIWGERDIILKFALPAALSGFVATPAVWLVYTFLVRQPDGYSQMGLFSAATSLKSAIIYLPQLINSVGMSLINAQKGLGNRANYKKVFWLNMAMTAGVVIVTALTIAVCGGWILRLFGKDFVDGHTVLFVLALATIPEALALATCQIVQSKGKMWLSFTAIVLPREFTSILAAYLLIPKHGAVGLATAYALSQSVAFAMTLTIVYFLGLECTPARSDQLKSSG